MVTGGESTPSRYFVAFAPRMKMKSTALVILGMGVMTAITVIGVNAVAPAALARNVAPGVVLLWLIAYAAFLAFAFKPQKIRVLLAGNSVTINQSAGDVFSLAGAKLGRWTAASYGTSQGTALHLRNARHTFVLGGRDHRMAADTKFQALPVRSVSAYMSAADFDVLLNVVRGRGALDGHPALAPEPIRCLLLPNVARFVARISFRGTPRPSLAIDVGPDVISVVDARTNAPISRTPLQQVRAIPAIHTYSGRVTYTMPVLVVQAPGVKPLSIGIPDFRFSWRGKVPTQPPPRYVVSGADWRTLVDALGLSPILEVSSD